MKYIIVDSVKDANRRIRRINIEKTGEILSGVTPCRLFDRAKDIVYRERASKGCFKAPVILDSISGAVLLDEIIEKNPQGNIFIPKESRSADTMQEVWNVFMKLRMCATSSYYQASEDKKLQQIRTMISDYEQELVRRDSYDECRMYREATAVLEKHPDWACSGADSYAITEDCYEILTEVQLKFLQQLCRENFEKLSVSADGTENLKAALSNAVYFRGYGIANEVAYVLREIEEKQLPLGEVLILYTSPHYEVFLESVFGSRKIPYCMTKRRTASDNRYLGLMKQILGWAASGYDYTELKKVVLCPGVSYTKKTESGEEQISSYIRPFYKGLQNEPEGEFKEWLKELKRVFCTEGENALSYADTYLRLVGFVRKTLGNHQDYKYIAQALYGETDYLRLLGNAPGEDVLIRALQKSADRITCGDEEEHDAVCMERFNGKVRMLDRKYVYLIGLSAAYVTSVGAESPVLSEEELQLCLKEGNGYLPLAGEQEAGYRRNLYRTLATKDEMTSLSIGYCGYDTVGLRSLAPSVLYLRMMEMTGVSEADIVQAKYEKLWTEPVKIEENSIWEEEAEEEEQEQEQKEQQKEYRWSASSLQTLINCPLSHYYQKICMIPEEVTPPDVTKQWLSAADRGTLAHSILQDYVEQWFVGKDAGDAVPILQTESFYKIVEDNVQKMIDKCPYESEAIYEREVKNISDWCEDYLEHLHAEFSDPENPWRILECEKEFENLCLYYNADGPCGKDADGAICFKFKGFIDRLEGYVDESGKMHYRVIDYKSGKKSYLAKGIEQGKKIQHIVYALALKDENTIVEEVCFHHLCEEDPKEQVYRCGRELLCGFPESVNDIICNSVLTGKYDKLKTTNCTFCTYKDICRENMGEDL